MSRVRERLGVLCDQVTRHATMAETIRNAQAGEALDRVLAALRGDAEVGDKELRLLLDAIDDACAAHGLAPVTVRGGRGYEPLPVGMGQVDPEPEPVKWGCPHGKCGRMVYAEETDSTPVCAVSGGGELIKVSILR